MTKKDFEARATEERREKRASARKASAQAISLQEYIEKYFSELHSSCRSFVIEIKRGAFGVYALEVPRDDFLTMLCDGLGYASTVAASEGMKRFSDSGKPCIRFRSIEYEQAREYELVRGYKLKRVYAGTHASMKREAQEKGFPTVGHFFQRLCAEAFEAEDCGEVDRKSHVFHTDLLRSDGTWSECKCYNGFIVCQFVNEFWKIV